MVVRPLLLWWYVHQLHPLCVEKDTTADTGVIQYANQSSSFNLAFFLAA